MASPPSFRRKLVLDSEDAPEDGQPNKWTCSYVMSSGDGVNLLGTLDVDKNRARFVANSGLFGTAYQFVMPRDQIQILRVPTASSPYNALELHTKYRQNILCDFDDNVATFRRCCEVMKLDVLPQDEPLIAVLPADDSDHANKWRARAAQKRREREAAEAAAARGGEPDDGHQLTQQVMHLHGEKVALQRRMTELERENQHLHGEVEVLYAQVDEQSEQSQRQREALEAAAREAVADALAADSEKTESRREFARDRTQPVAFRREEEERTDAASTRLDAFARENVDAAPEKRNNAQRQDELLCSVATLREERSMFEGEVARLRAELERRDAERETKRANATTEAERENENPSSPDASGEDDMQDMLASEVQRLLAKQAELSNHLARARREKEMLERENELLYQKTEAVEEAAETARAERASARDRLSEAASEARRARERAIAPSSPPREEDAVSPSVSAKALALETEGVPRAGAGAMKKRTEDGPDAELAAKLIGRLERGGESDEAASLKLEMERVKAELGRMRAERAESVLTRSDRATELSFDERERSGVAAAASAAASALRAELEKKEEELQIEKRRVAEAVAAATERAAAEAAAREKEDALWRVTEAELRAADAERALDALRREKEESERRLALVTEELRSERSRSRAGSTSRASDCTRDSETDAADAFAVPLPDPPDRVTGAARERDRVHSPPPSSSDAGWSVPESVWQEILLEKDSALSALEASDKAKEDELTRLRDRLARFERKGPRKRASTPSPAGGRGAGGDHETPRGAANRNPAVATKPPRGPSAGVAFPALPAIDTKVSAGDTKSPPRADASTDEDGSPSAKSPRSPFAKGIKGLGAAAAGFVFGKRSPR